jgi:tripartite ATP-independent transporter DctM subunit
MLRYGYSQSLATGVIAASGTLAQIIPPSIVLIVMADVLGRSIGQMYAGALLPGLMLTGMYMLWVFANTLFRPQSAPALPPEARTLHGAALAWRVTHAMIPPLVLVFLVLGTIFIGWATPTEGGAMGAVGALILAAAKGRLDRRVLVQSLEQTGKITSFVLFILIGSSVFSLTFRGVNGDLWVEHLLTSLPGGVIGFLIFVNLLVFLLAFFLDFFEISFIILPLLAPVAEKLGIDLVWFGVLLAVNMQTSFMHPPFGFALFYLRSVAPPQVRTSQIYWGAIPFLGIQLTMVALIIAFPGLVRSERDVAPAVVGAPVEVIAPAGEAPSLLDSPDFRDLFERAPRAE